MSGREQVPTDKPSEGPLRSGQTAGFPSPCGPCYRSPLDAVFRSETEMRGAVLRNGKCDRTAAQAVTEALVRLAKAMTALRRAVMVWKGLRSPTCAAVT